jgi:hypothetical protein
VWADCVIPFRMEHVAFVVESVHLGVGDFDALLARSSTERALDAQSRLGRGGRDQFDDGQSVNERSAAGAGFDRTLGAWVPQPGGACRRRNGFTDAAIRWTSESAI